MQSLEIRFRSWGEIKKNETKIGKGNKKNKKNKKNKNKIQKEVRNFFLQYPNKSTLASQSTTPRPYFPSLPPPPRASSYVSSKSSQPPPFVRILRLPED